MRFLKYELTRLIGHDRFTVCPEVPTPAWLFRIQAKYFMPPFPPTGPVWVYVYSCKSVCRAACKNRFYLYIFKHTFMCTHTYRIYKIYFIHERTWLYRMHEWIHFFDSAVWPPVLDFSLHRFSLSQKLTYFLVKLFPYENKVCRKPC
jgi:hypothetical protein